MASKKDNLILARAEAGERYRAALDAFIQARIDLAAHDHAVARVSRESAHGFSGYPLTKDHLAHTTFANDLRLDWHTAVHDRAQQILAERGL